MTLEEQEQLTEKDNAIKKLIADMAGLEGELEEKDKQIEELKEKLHNAKYTPYSSCDFAEKNKKLETQIEKMKCCENCRHHSFWGDELKCNLDYDTGFECLKTKSNWELKE